MGLLLWDSSYGTPPRGVLLKARWTDLLLDLLQLVALLPDVVQQLQGLVVLSGDLHAGLLQAPLQALQTNTS